MQKEKEERTCKKKFNCVNVSTSKGLNTMLDSLHDKLDVLNYNIYMDEKQEREFKKEQLAKKRAAIKIAQNKEQTKREGAKRTAARLSGQTNLSQKQMQARIRNDDNNTGPNINPAPTGLNNQDSQGAQGSQSAQNTQSAQGSQSAQNAQTRGTTGQQKKAAPKAVNNAGGDGFGMEGTQVTVADMRQSEKNLSTFSNNTSSYQGGSEKKDLAKYEKKTVQSKKNEKGIEQGSGEGGSEEVEDAKNDPPHSSELE